MFENWSEIKIIWKKTKVLKFIQKLKARKIIWKLAFWKLNSRIGILGIKFERNSNFENYLRIGVLKIKFERNWSSEN